MTILNSQKYHKWIKEIQAYAKHYQVWEYVDSDEKIEPSQKEASFKTSDYQMIESDADTLRSALNLKKLSDKQRKEYKADVLEY
jgi:hypothetical protein